MVNRGSSLTTTTRPKSLQSLNCEVESTLEERAFCFCNDIPHCIRCSSDHLAPYNLRLIHHSEVIKIFHH